MSWCFRMYSGLSVADARCELQAADKGLTLGQLVGDKGARGGGSGTHERRAETTEQRLSASVSKGSCMSQRKELLTLHPPS